MTEKFKSDVEVVFYFISIVILIVGAGFTSCEYFDYKQYKKEERSWGYVDEMLGKEFRETSRNMDGASEKIKLIMKEHGFFNSTKNFREIYYHYFPSYYKSVDPSIVHEFDYLLGFFDKARWCVEKNMCDKDVFDEYAMKDGVALINFIWPYICEKRGVERGGGYMQETARYFIGVDIDCTK